MDNHPLHILIIASWYPSDESPTYGSFVKEQVDMLQANGHHVTVLHPELTGTFVQSLGKPNHSVKRTNASDIEVIRVKTTPVLPKMRGLSYSRLTNVCIEEVDKIHNKRSIDIIHAHAVFMGGLVAEGLSKYFKIPFVITEHTSGLIFSPKQYTPKDRSRISRCYDNAEKVIHVSRYAKEEITKKYSTKKGNHIVIPNIVDDMFFEQALMDRNNKPFHFAAIGNLIPRKNFDLLLSSFKGVFDKDNNVRLTIAGEGQERERLVKLSNNLGLSDHVAFLDKLDRIQVAHLLSDCHVHVSTSRLETFGLTVAESIACGTPVVVTDSGGVRDIVDNTNGILTKPGLLTESLLDIKNKYHQFDHAVIQEKAKDKFSSDHVYNMIYNEYRKII